MNPAHFARQPPVYFCFDSLSVLLLLNEFAVKEGNLIRCIKCTHTHTYRLLLVLVVVAKCEMLLNVVDISQMLSNTRQNVTKVLPTLRRHSNLQRVV